MGISLYRSKQKDLVRFFEEALDIILMFCKQRSLGHEKLYFGFESESYKWFKVDDEDWIRNLLCCLYISMTDDHVDLIIIENPETFPVGILERVRTNEKIASDEEENLFQDDAKWEDIEIERIFTELNSGFTDNINLSRIKNSYRIFEESRAIILSSPNIFSIDKEFIEAYLNSYYNLVTNYLIFCGELDDKYRTQLEDIFLHIGTKKIQKDSDIVYRFSLRAPIVLAKIKKIEYGIQKFYEEIIQNQMVQYDLLCALYKDILLSKIQHILRWFVAGKNGELYHAAVAPYVEQQNNELFLQVVARNLIDYSSFEGVGELRLGEKIIYEIDKLGLAGERPFRVAILGDINRIPAKKLYDYVMQEMNCKHRLEFEIYTKNKWDSEIDTDNKQNITYNDNLHDVLTNRKKLENVIDNNNVVFILDCIELYQISSGLEIEKQIFLKQRYLFSTYGVYVTGRPKVIDICDNTLLEELYETLVSDRCFAELGKIKKQANQELIKFCAEKQKERGNDGAIYIYVSDLNAFNNVYYDDQYYVRTERYNEKEIGIIRYSSEEISALPTSAENKMIVFNIWQFVKNVSIGKKQIFESKWKKIVSKCNKLAQIYIGIDYRQWPQKLVLHYTSLGRDKETQISEGFINDILLPIMNKEDSDMFTVSIKKAMCSFLYSAAKSVDDMLFIHLFQNKSELLGKVILAEKNDREMVEHNINIHYKYSSKRFYNMIMKNYDIGSNCFLGQMETNYIITRQQNQVINKKQIYQNVLQSCENLSYMETNLYKNCVKEL